MMGYFETEAERKICHCINFELANVRRAISKDDEGWIGNHLFKAKNNVCIASSNAIVHSRLYVVHTASHI